MPISFFFATGAWRHEPHPRFAENKLRWKSGQGRTVSSRQGAEAVKPQPVVPSPVRGSLTRRNPMVMEMAPGKLALSKIALEATLQTLPPKYFFTSRCVFQADFIFFKQSLAIRVNMVYWLLAFFISVFKVLGL
jgi:hypothetical protein